MKIIEGLDLVTIAGENIVVPLGTKNVDFNEKISLNECGAFLWRQLEEEKTERALLKALLQEYEVDEEAASADIRQFLNRLGELGILD